MPTVRKRVVADPRAQRSVSAIGCALVQLMHEREFHNITVQDIVNRAGVSRATFYVHYRNREDVLLTAYEHLFVIVQDWLIFSTPSKRARLFPVAEFLAHLAEAEAFVNALRAASKLETMYELTVGFATQMITARLGVRPSVSQCDSVAVVGRMAAGALIEMVKWWLERAERPSPNEMDYLFHDTTRSLLRRFVR